MWTYLGNDKCDFASGDAVLARELESEVDVAACTIPQVATDKDIAVKFRWSGRTCTGRGDRHPSHAHGEVDLEVFGHALAKFAAFAAAPDCHYITVHVQPCIARLPVSVYSIRNIEVLYDAVGIVAVDAL